MLRSDIYNIITKKEPPKNELFDNILNEGEFKALIVKGSDGKSRVVNFRSAEAMKNAIKRGTHKPIGSKTSEKPADDTQLEKPVDDTQLEKPADDTQLEKPVDDTQTELPDSEIKGLKDKNRENLKAATVGVVDEVIKKEALEERKSAPGNKGSVINEICVGVGLYELLVNPNISDDDLISNITEFVKSSKIYKSNKKSSNDEAIKSAANASKIEYIRVLKLIAEKGINSEAAIVSHIWGAQESLSNTVSKLKEMGVNTVNDIDIEEYEEIIMAGGAGENPTDTMILVTDNDGNAHILHTSNKMTSADIQANSGPVKNIENIQKTLLEMEDLNISAEDLENISKKHIDELKNKNDEIKKVAIERVSEAREDIRGFIDGLKNASSNEGDEKYWNLAVERFSGVNKNGELTTNVRKRLEKFSQKDENGEIKEEYKEFIKRVENREKLTDKDEEKIANMFLDSMEYTPKEGESATVYSLNNDNIAGANRVLYTEDDEIKLRELYGEQLDIQNNYRETLNNITDGAGDLAFSKLFWDRLHLDISSGHNPGGIPNENFSTIMGVDKSDLRISSDGQHYIKKGNSLFKLDLETGELEETPAQLSKEEKKEIKTSDNSIVINREILAAALQSGVGVEIGEDYWKNIKVEYLQQGKGNTGSALLYYEYLDVEGEQQRLNIGSQDVRPKGGQGTKQQDTIKYHRDFQTRLAIESLLWQKRNSDFVG